MTPGKIEAAQKLLAEDSPNGKSLRILVFPFLHSTDGIQHQKGLNVRKIPFGAVTPLKYPVCIVMLLA
jgi:hypothetical protein